MSEITLSKNNKLFCKKCKSDFSYQKNDCFWDEKGLTSTKLTKCPSCETPVVVSYWEPNYFDTNLDPRFYEYLRK